MFPVPGTQANKNDMGLPTPAGSETCSARRNTQPRDTKFGRVKPANPKAAEKPGVSGLAGTA